MRTATLLVLMLMSVGNARAMLVTLDLTGDNDNMSETPGEALESSGSYTIHGLTLSVATIPVNSFVANAGDAGVGSGAMIGAGETLTFTFTFTATSAELVSIDFAGIGPSADDDATVQVDASTFTLETGAANFDGGIDLWSPSIALLPGSTVTFTYPGTGNGYSLEAITLNIAAIPEPTAALFGGLMASALGLTVARRGAGRSSDDA